MSAGARLYSWLDRRYQIGPLVAFLGHKEVPLGRGTVFYYLGGLSLLFLMVQVLSGFLLLAYYQPGQETAYESLHHITTKVPFGWLIRSVHCWSAHLMLCSLTVHMASTLLAKAYRPPRELTWVTGCVLFVLALTFGFSGYLLPWNELAYFATSVGTDSVKSVPLLGDWLVRVLRGGPDVSSDTLHRFFALHVCLLPLATFAVLGLHLVFIQRQGMAPHLGAPPGRGMRFFPSFLVRDLILWALSLAAILTLAVLWPYGPGLPGVDWELGTKANPLAPAPPGIKPEWYFLWAYQLLKEFPPHLLGLEGPQVCLLLIGLVATGWVLLPWLDRRAARSQPSPGVTDLAVAACFGLGFLTLKAWDLGAAAGADPDPAATARASALLSLAALAIVTGLRVKLLQHRYLCFSGGFALLALLHGLLGWSFLVAGAVGFGAVLPLVVLEELRARRPGPSAEAT